MKFNVKFAADKSEILQKNRRPVGQRSSDKISLRFQLLPVLRFGKIARLAVIGVHPPAGAAIFIRAGPQGQGGVVQLGGAAGGSCHRHRMARADEQQHFVQCAADVVVPGGQ